MLQQPTRIEDVGLQRPQPGTLGWHYAAALIIGCSIGIALGKATNSGVGGEWMLLASLLLWQPLVEELLFRGLLQGFFRHYAAGRKSIAGVSVANVITSVGFALFHLVNQPPLWAFAVFVPSLVFGFFRDRTGSVWPAVLLHALFNAAFFLS